MIPPEYTPELGLSTKLPLQKISDKWYNWGMKPVDNMPRHILFDARLTQGLPELMPPSLALTAKVEKEALEAVLLNTDFSKLRLIFDEAAQRLSSVERSAPSTWAIDEYVREILIYFEYMIFQNDINNVPSPFHWNHRSLTSINGSSVHQEQWKKLLVDEFLGYLGEDFFELLKNQLNQASHVAMYKVNEILLAGYKQTPLYLKIQSLGLQLEDIDAPMGKLEREQELRREEGRVRGLLARSTVPLDPLYIERNVATARLKRDIQLDDHVDKSNNTVSKSSVSWQDDVKKLILDTAIANVADQTEIEKQRLTAVIDDSGVKILITDSQTGDKWFMRTKDHVNSSILEYLFTPKNEITGGIFETGKGFPKTNFGTVINRDHFHENVLNFLSAQDSISSFFSLMRAKSFVVSLNSGHSFSKQIIELNEYGSFYQQWVNSIRATRKGIEEDGSVASSEMDVSSKVFSRADLDFRKSVKLGEIVKLDSNPALQQSLVVVEPYDVIMGDVDESIDCDLVLKFPSLKSYSYPLVYGYTLLGRSGDSFFYSRDESYCAKSEATIDLRSTSNKKLTRETLKEIEELGLKDLARELDKSLKKLSRVSLNDVAEIVSRNTSYTFDESKELENAVSLGDFRDCVVDGKLAVQCTGANSFLLAVIKKIAPDLPSELVAGHVLDQNDKIIDASGHCVVRVATSKGLVLIDAVGAIERSQPLQKKVTKPFVPEILSTEVQSGVVEFMQRKAEKESKAREEAFSSLAFKQKDVVTEFITGISENIRIPRETLSDLVLKRERLTSGLDPVAKAYRAIATISNLSELEKTQSNGASTASRFKDFERAFNFLEHYNGNRSFFEKHPNIKKIDPRIVDALVEIMRPIYESTEMQFQLENARTVENSPMTIAL